MFISVTSSTQGIILLEIQEISRIVEDATSGAVVVCLLGSQDKIEPSETMDQIFDQQNVTGRNLGMILITNQRTGNREIWFTKDLLMIVAEPGGGSKLLQKIRKETIVASETLTTILAYQGATKNLGLISATVTSVSPNQQYLFVDKMIRQIVSSDPTNVASAAIIDMKGSWSSYTVVETVAVLTAAMPT